MRSLTLALIVLTLPVGLAAADDYQLQSLRIEHPFARATPPGARVAGVFLTIENTGRQPDRLLRVSSPVAGVAELHEMKMDAGMMKMRAVQSLEVKPGESLVLKPGGYHVMLTELKQPLKTGDSFPLTLTFDKAGTVEVSVSVEDIGASSGAGRKP